MSTRPKRRSTRSEEYPTESRSRVTSSPLSNWVNDSLTTVPPSSLPYVFTFDVNQFTFLYSFASSSFFSRTPAELYPTTPPPRFSNRSRWPRRTTRCSRYGPKGRFRSDHLQHLLDLLDSLARSLLGRSVLWKVQDCSACQHHLPVRTHFACYLRYSWYHQQEVGRTSASRASRSVLMAFIFSRPIAASSDCSPSPSSSWESVPECSSPTSPP
jgi:hypothetical protein